MSSASTQKYAQKKIKDSKSYLYHVSRYNPEKYVEDFLRELSELKKKSNEAEYLESKSTFYEQFFCTSTYDCFFQISKISPGCREWETLIQWKTAQPISFACLEFEAKPGSATPEAYLGREYQRALLDQKQIWEPSERPSWQIKGFVVCYLDGSVEYCQMKQVTAEKGPYQQQKEAGSKNYDAKYDFSKIKKRPHYHQNLIEVSSDNFGAQQDLNHVKIALEQPLVLSKREECIFLINRKGCLKILRVNENQLGLTLILNFSFEQYIGCATILNYPFTTGSFESTKGIHVAVSLSEQNCPMVFEIDHQTKPEDIQSQYAFSTQENQGCKQFKHKFLRASLANHANSTLISQRRVRKFDNQIVSIDEGNLIIVYEVVERQECGFKGKMQSRLCLELKSVFKPCFDEIRQIQRIKQIDVCDNLILVITNIKFGFFIYDSQRREILVKPSDKEYPYLRNGYILQVNEQKKQIVFAIGLGFQADKQIGKCRLTTTLHIRGVHYKDR